MGPHYHRKYVSHCSIFSQFSIFLLHGEKRRQYTRQCKRRGVHVVVGMQNHPSPPLSSMVVSQVVVFLSLTVSSVGPWPTTSQLHLLGFTLFFSATAITVITHRHNY